MYTFTDHLQIGRPGLGAVADHLQNGRGLPKVGTPVRLTRASESLRGFPAPVGIGSLGHEQRQGLTQARDKKTAKTKYHALRSFSVKILRYANPAPLTLRHISVILKYMGCRFSPASDLDFAAAGNVSASHVIINLWTYVNVKQKVCRTKKAPKSVGVILGIITWIFGVFHIFKSQNDTGGK